MLPGLWRCQSDFLLDALGILIQPTGLVLLLGIWGALATFEHRWERRMRWLLRVIAIEAILLWTLLLLAVPLVRNPTGIIECGEYLGIVASWLTVLVCLWPGVRTMWHERSSRPVKPTTTTQPYRESSISATSTSSAARLQRTLEVGSRLAPWIAMALTVVGSFALAFSAVLPVARAASDSAALYLLPAAGAWTLVVLLRSPTTDDPASSDRVALSPKSRRRVGMVLLLVAGSYLGLALIVSLSDHDSPWRSAGKAASWVLAVNTAPVATDECLVYRIARYGGARAPVGSGEAERGTRAAAGRLGGKLGRGIVQRAGNAAAQELSERGKSALPTIERGLLAAIDSDDAEVQENLSGLLKRATQWPEVDFIVRRWAHATPAPARQAVVKNWLVCIERGRRHLVGAATDSNCEVIAGERDILPRQFR